MESTRSVTTLVFFVSMMVTATSRPSESLTNLILTTYQRHLEAEVRQALSLHTHQNLPQDVVALLQGIQKHQLPVVLQTITKGINTGEIKNIGEDLEGIVKTFTDSLHLKEFFVDKKYPVRRDDEEMMPNMLDHYYGGFGK